MEDRVDLSGQIKMLKDWFEFAITTHETFLRMWLRMGVVMH